MGVKGDQLFCSEVGISADCADVGNMRLTVEAGIYALTLAGGDASEAYSVKVFFTSEQVKKREVYDLDILAVCVRVQRTHRRRFWTSR